MYESFGDMASAVAEQEMRMVLKRIAEGTLEQFLHALQSGGLDSLFEPIETLMLSDDCTRALQQLGFCLVGELLRQQRSYYQRMLGRDHLNELHHALKGSGRDLGRFYSDPVSRYLGDALALAYDGRTTAQISAALAACYKSLH